MRIIFIIVKFPAFLALLDLFTSILITWISSNSNILQSWIMKAFNNRKILLIENMKEVYSNIHLLFDMWTFSNSFAFVAIVAYCIDNNLKLQTTLIGQQQVIGSYFSKIVAEYVVSVIQEYSFQKKLGYFVLDNATSNNTCIEAIFIEIQPDLIKKKQRLCCIVDHIIKFTM